MSDERPTTPVPALDPQTAGLLAGLRARLTQLSESQRVYVFVALTEDYCRDCGSEKGWTCMCQRDE